LMDRPGSLGREKGSPRGNNHRGKSIKKEEIHKGFVEKGKWRKREGRQNASASRGVGKGKGKGFKRSRSVKRTGEGKHYPPPIITSVVNTAGEFWKKSLEGEDMRGA